MEHYVTLLNYNYMPQLLALHMSMLRHLKEDFTLWIVCVDEEIKICLSKLILKNVKLIDLNKYECVNLKRVKKIRSIGEFCWTLTPFVPKYVFNEDETVPRVTYIDCDMWFRKHPNLIFKEFENSNKSILITDHSYDPSIDQSETSGQFCVQFIIFKNNTESELIRKTWEDQCIDWCYAYPSNGRFGDQKYLDSWPLLFDKDVHILSNKELILGPWNAMRFPYGNSCLWHFHAVRLLITNKKIIFNGSWYSIPRPTRKYVYDKYVLDVVNALNLMKNNSFIIKSQIKLSIKDYLLGKLRVLFYKSYSLRSGYIKTYNL
jgi:hypothetical protein